ncbi:MAG: tetratricopeptide repeat protein [Acidobacteria bacterium]|nr:tetratricopeptide repeat protein [Acidobacteriota bacterium]
MTRPLLRQDWELSVEDFQNHPLWLAVHGRDQSEEWYEQCDEETFRPWDGMFPAAPQSGAFLVAAWMKLRKGRTYPGAFYVNLPEVAADASSIARYSFDGASADDVAAAMRQPRIFHENRCSYFWGGKRGVPSSDQEVFYLALQDVPENIFPITYEALPGVISGSHRGIVRGFYRLLSSGINRVIIDPDPGQVEQAVMPLDGEQNGTLIQSITGLAQQGNWRDALTRADDLVAAHPRESRYWTLKATVHAISGNLPDALLSAIRAVECDPSNRGLYPWVCVLQLQVGDFQGCLDYSNSGLAAKAGPRESRSWHTDQLIFLSARALYELGHPAESADRLVSLPPTYAMGKRGDALMTKKGLLRACQTARRKMRPES